MNNFSNLPDYMVPGLMRYIDHGIVPGSFLLAVLENDLREAASQADSNNALLLVAYVRALYNEAPAACWGSPAKVHAWAAEKERERDAATADRSASA